QNLKQIEVIKQRNKDLFYKNYGMICDKTNNSSPQKETGVRRPSQEPQVANGNNVTIGGCKDSGSQHQSQVKTSIIQQDSNEDVQHMRTASSDSSHHPRMSLFKSNSTPITSMGTNHLFKTHQGHESIEAMEFLSFVLQIEPNLLFVIH